MKAVKRFLLVVEDSAGDARLLQEMLLDENADNIDVNIVTSMQDAEKYFADHAVDVVLLDLGLPDCSGLQAIVRAKLAAPRVPLVVVTGHDDEALAVLALQSGAQDYLIKGQIESRGLLRALRYAIERKRLDRLKDEFVATVSHELRTPLTSISGSLALLAGDAAGKLPAVAGRLVGIAQANCQRLVRLVDDILDMGKLEFGLVAFRERFVDFRLLVKQAVDHNLDFARSQNVRIRIEPSHSPSGVRADPDRLTQVVTNLLSNAIKFSPAGGEIGVVVEKVDETVCLSVRNQGAAISEDFKSRVFERFTQADSTDSRRKGGSGLGLSIAKQIVDRLGGKIGFEDAVGGGTIFRVELPAWKIANDETPSVDPSLVSQQSAQFQ